jgi:hypothetical protein
VGKIIAGIYLLAVGVALFLIHAFPPPGDIAYLSVAGALAAWVLTLPWSFLLVPFMWALFHDAQNLMFSIFFIASASANAYFINRIVNSFMRRKAVG